MSAPSSRAPAGTDAESSDYSLSEEAREFFQGRLQILAKIVFWFTFVFLAVAWMSFLARGRLVHAGEFALDTLYMGLANMACAGLVWLACWHIRITVHRLRWLDGLLVIAYGLTGALRAWTAREESTALALSVIPFTFIILTRAVIIPSRAARTAWLSFLCFVPSLTVTVLVWRETGIAPGPEDEQLDLFLYGFRGLLLCALATTVSQVVYGLRREVREVRQLGQYQLDEKLGEGGMGEVYRAHHALLRRPTAVKLLLPQRAGENSIRRFEREVQLTCALSHPNTIAIYDYGRTPDGTFYYAMELLEGLNVDQLVKLFGPQPPARVLHVLEQVCGSLSEAHARGLVHRDIKPANIILCERGGILDFVKVVDFGLVKEIDGAAGATLTSPDAITGTPLYMSPEAIRTPESIDGRSDLYALGAVGYFLLAGSHVFESDNPLEVCSLQLQAVPDPPSARLGRELPADLERLILSCLEKDREERPASAGVLLSLLSACRDAGTWTQSDAARWWEAAFRESVRPQPAPDRSARHASTVVVDMRGRLHG